MAVRRVFRQPCSGVRTDFAMVFRLSALLGTLLTLLLVLWVRKGASQALEVPVRLQAELLAKVAAYDRGFTARAGARAQVLVAVKHGDPESERIGEQILAELAVLEQIGGLPHSQEIMRFETVSGLVDVVRTRKPAIVYFSARLSDQIEAIANGLRGMNVLTVGVSSSYVSKRAVLGFDSESGKPKLVVHLEQAKQQQVAFKPELLRLARVVQ